MIGTIRYCKTNNDFYIVIKKEKNDFYKVYWLEIGFSSDDVSDIENDEVIHKIPKSLVKKADYYNVLRLCKTAWEVKNGR